MITRFFEGVLPWSKSRLNGRICENHFVYNRTILDETIPLH
ncbi:MAG: hypothetical protein ACTS6A_00780 [Candidatus Hodgkinia cicadicola]